MRWREVPAPMTTRSRLSISDLSAMMEMCVCALAVQCSWKRRERKDREKVIQRQDQAICASIRMRAQSLSSRKQAVGNPRQRMDAAARWSAHGRIYITDRSICSCKWKELSCAELRPSSALQNASREEWNGGNSKLVSRRTVECLHYFRRRGSQPVARSTCFTHSTFPALTEISTMIVTRVRLD
jgi:hypothetical protein